MPVSNLSVPCTDILRCGSIRDIGTLCFIGIPKKMGSVNTVYAVQSTFEFGGLA